MAQSKTTPNYCIIGAGAGGLTCARHALDTGAKVVVFEQTNKLGGTWVYTDQTGRDRNGLPIHTSMYWGLRANLPKQTMGYFDSDIQSSYTYAKQEDVLAWLESYAEKFELERCIRFEHQVMRIAPSYGGEKWEVIVRDLVNKRFEMMEFDFVMICNGHYSRPLIPSYPEKELFRGVQIHSHDYRSADRFRGQDVLIVGAGFSATDIAIAVIKEANTLTVSYHTPEKANFGNLPSLITKPSISSLTSTGAKFLDGTESHFSSIIYCTGYRFTYPFLSVDSGISLEDNHVQPLYKHVLNINHPTMALIGVPFYCCPTQMMDLQARFCIKFWTGEKQLPSREEMLADTSKDMELRRERGLPKKWMHKLVGDLQFKYYDDLAVTAGIEPLKPVVEKLYTEWMRRRDEDVQGYREDVFEVVGDSEFRRVLK